MAKIYHRCSKLAVSVETSCTADARASEAERVRSLKRCDGREQTLRRNDDQDLPILYRPQYMLSRAAGFIISGARWYTHAEE